MHVSVDRQTDGRTDAQLQFAGPWSQELYRKISNPNTSYCYNEKKQYPRSIDPQSKHKLFLRSKEIIPQMYAEHESSWQTAIVPRLWVGGLLWMGSMVVVSRTVHLIRYVSVPKAR
jgi:hypothetical protein